MIVISACLVGENCKYNGGNNECLHILDFFNKNKDECILVCPERDVFSTPRPTVEIISGRAVNIDGKDVTDGFIKGAELEWEKIKVAAKGKKIEKAILKANSPSCGCETIYDGTFSGKLKAGDGFFSKLLKEKGIRVFTENNSEMS